MRGESSPPRSCDRSSSRRQASLYLFLMQRTHKAAIDWSAPTARWMDADAAADILGLSVVTLRRALERNARVETDGATIARVDGITGRKLGRLWRVLLDAKWMGTPIEQG